jgi:hypothetical protein
VVYSLNTENETHNGAADMKTFLANQEIKMTNKAFNGVQGYHLTTTETIVSLIAKGILEGHHIYAAEVALSYNNTFIIGQYEMKVA